MLKINPKLSKEAKLKILENEYRHLVKNVPTSFNATREWHKQVDACVQSMRRLRNISATSSDTSWLQKILTWTPTE